MGKVWETDNHRIGAFFPLDSYPMAYSIIWEMHGFPINFPHYGKDNKTHCIGRTWKIGTHTFPIVWMLFPIRYQSYGILHHMRNAWVSPSIFHSTGKFNKIHRFNKINAHGLILFWFKQNHSMGRTWEIGTHRFPII